MTVTGKISVILPTYNERVNAVLLIEEIHRALGDRPHEVVVADDDSPDGTHDAVVALNDARVVALRRTSDRGLAKSLRAGIEASTGDVVVLMDSDFNHQPDYLPFMVDALAHYDCVTASRFLYGGRMFPRSRHLLSWGFNVFTRAATGGQITDNLYGYVAIRREVLSRCPFDEIFWGYGDYCIRLLYFLQVLGASILQFPAVNGSRRAGVGNSRFLKVFLQYATEVAKLAVKTRVLNHAPGN
jgi:dolichol-phosphate mannosyltransferase